MWAIMEKFLMWDWSNRYSNLLGEVSDFVGADDSVRPQESYSVNVRVDRVVRPYKPFNEHA